MLTEIGHLLNTNLKTDIFPSQLTGSYQLTEHFSFQNRQKATNRIAARTVELDKVQAIVVIYPKVSLFKLVTDNVADTKNWK